MKAWHILGLGSCLLSCQLIFLPNKALFEENTVLNCFDGVDNDGKNGADCDDPSCDAICNDDQLSITAVTTNNCTVVAHEGLSGDDRGGIAVGLNQVLYSGDLATVSFEGDDLAAQAYPFIYDTMFSDLRSGKIYVFLDSLSGAPLDGPEGEVNSFRELDPSSGELSGAPIPLSLPINLTNAGFFSGKGLAVIQSADALFSINLADGAVTQIDAVPFFDHQSCENKAYWGIAERVDDQLSLVYVANSTTIARTHITGPAASTEVIARFAALDDMCSISVSPRLGRWYFHAEGLSIFSANEEYVGYCDVVLGDAPAPSCGDGISQAPEECDDGNNVDGDGCTSSCVLEVCGDGAKNRVVRGQPFEACDDGNNNSGDGCRGDCLGTEVCGDGLVDVGEQCDDGNNVDGDGCEANCTFACAANLSPKVAFFNAADGRCYTVLNAFGDWPTMRQACVDAGGDLASITSAAEAAIVLPAANFSPWIGLNDLALEGDFTWSNGDALSFNNFAAGEPNDTDASEDCVSMKDGGAWNDLPCTEGHKALCEIP